MRRRSGAGCWHFADGATLRGVFVDDALHGRGVYTHADGRTTGRPALAHAVPGTLHHR